MSTFSAVSVAHLDTSDGAGSHFALFRFDLQGEPQPINSEACALSDLPEQREQAARKRDEDLTSVLEARKWVLEKADSRERDSFTDTHSHW